ncbi:MAG: mitofilin family membrane protein [Rhodospirillales bacterium]|nr:mitofilin family membrane protein [Rhodospirillales bacterium]
MAARNDDDQKPPEGSRQTVIWRLPAAGSSQRAEAPEALDSSDAGADRPKGRRAPLLAAIGLAVALVCVGLYAAWSEFGSDIFGTGGDPDVAAAPSAAPAVQTTGDGLTGGGTAASPPADAVGTPLAGVEQEDESAGIGAVEEDAPVVATPQDDKTDPPETAVPEPAAPAAEPPSPSPALAADDPLATPVVASARAEERATPDAAAPVEAIADAVPDTPPVTSLPAQADPGTGTLAVETLGVLNARLEALEARSDGAIGAGAAVIALEQRIRALEDDPTREPLGEALAAWGEQRAALEAALAQVSERLARFEEEAVQQAAADGQLVTLVLATGELTAVLGSSRPFAPALDTIRGIAGEDPEIEGALARLAPFAATGVPTLDGLSARFPQAANAIVRGTAATEEEGWIDETVTRLSQLVTIRRTGGAIDSASLEGRLVEAEAALKAGDLEQAIAIVEPLMGDDAEAGSAGPWLRDARARHEADTAIAGLVATVHARIGARWATTGGTQ